MFDPFAAALQPLFNGPGSAAAAYLTAAGNTSSPIRVIVTQRTEERGVVRPHREVTGRLIEVKHIDVPSPAVGDVIAIGADLYQVAALPESDTEQLTWTFDVPKLGRTMAVLRAGLVRNAYGDDEEGFVAQPPVPAARVDLTGQETANSGGFSQMAALQISVFFCSWSSTLADLSPKDRIQQDDRTYDVQSVAEIGTRAGIEITAIARVA